VVSITPRPGTHTVHNLEVHLDHVYHVAASGVLVHNAVPAVPCPKTVAEQHISRHVIDMNNAPAKSDLTALGFKRNGPWFWRQLRQKTPELFSDGNKRAIAKGRSPVVDETWVKYNPQHASQMGEKLVHHHIDQGRFASGLPESLHESLFKWLHNRTVD
jgi:hypothetical protein